MKFDSSSFSGYVSSLRRREIKETFFRIIDRVKEKKVDFLFVTGDLFENEYITAGELKEINSTFGEIPKTKVIIITGNHDPLIGRSKYDIIKFCDNVHIVREMFEKIYFDDLNVVIYASSWKKSVIEENMLQGISIEDKTKINILLAHGDAYNKNSQYLPINKDELIKKGFDYAALGHIHKHDMLTNSIIYPGSPEPFDFGETGIHGIIEGKIDKNSITAEFIPFSKRIFIINEVEINEGSTRREIVEMIRETGDDKNLVRIILKGFYNKDVDMDIEDMQNELKEDFFYLEIINNAEEDLDIDSIYKENKSNLIGEYILEMKKKHLDDEVINDAFKLGLQALIKNRGE